MTKRLAALSEPERKRAVIYVRVSQDATGEGKSVSRQLAKCKALAEYRGWDVVFIKEETGSALKERPVWREVLALIDAGKVDVVIAWHIDRMMRSMSDLEELILLAVEKNVGIATATGDIDLTNDMGRLVARILAAVARAEVERKGERQRLANEARAMAGQPHLGGPMNFGFERDGITVNTLEAMAIRDGAQRVLKGTPVNQVRAMWEAQGLVSSKSSKAKAGWSAQGVRQVLINPRYAGIRVYRGKEIGTAKWDAILPLETHLALKAMLTDPARMRGERRFGRTPSTLLTGIAKCSVCGGTARGSSTHIREGMAPDEHLRYACSQRHCFLVPRRQVDAWVTAFVLDVASDPDVLSMLAGTGDEDVDAAKVQAILLRERQDALARSFARGLIKEQAMEAGISEIQGLLDEAESVLTRAGAGATVASLLTGGDVRQRWYEIDLLERRKIVDALVKVELKPLGRSASVRNYDPADNVIISPKFGASV